MTEIQHGRLNETSRNPAPRSPVWVNRVEFGMSASSPVCPRMADIMVLCGVNEITTRNLACHIQMLRTGERTRSHRHTGTWIYHVHSGTGVTVVGEDGPTKLEWLDKDAFVVPSWEPHYHQNLSARPAYLFSVTDRPIVEAAGLYREDLSPSD